MASITQKTTRTKRVFVLVLTMMILMPPFSHSRPKSRLQSTHEHMVVAKAISQLNEQPESVEEVSPPLPERDRLSSSYGWRKSRRTGKRTFHAGLDFHAKKGTPVYAVRSGIVEKVLRNTRRKNGFSGYGNAVVIYHPDEDRWSFYAHLDKTTVKAGARVLAGQTIGHVGNTNNGRFPGMGVHLHFEARVRTKSGVSPFPGAYRKNNRNPKRWLARHGVKYNRRGRLI